MKPIVVYSVALSALVFVGCGGSSEPKQPQSESLTNTGTALHSELSGKIALLVTAFETPDTRTDGLFSPPELPAVITLPHTQAEIDALPTEKARDRAILDNLEASKVARMEFNRAIASSYERNVLEAEKRAGSSKDTELGRIRTLGRDLLIPRLMEHSDRFVVVTRQDGIENILEACAGNNATSLEVPAYFVKVILDRPIVKEGAAKVDASGNVHQKSYMTETVICHVYDMHNTVVFSKEYKKTGKKDAELRDIIGEVFVEFANDLAGHFRK